MDFRHTKVDQSVGSDGLSRREMVLRVGASGLALALATNRVEASLAQDESPAAAQLPEGITFTLLGGAPILDLPKEPFTLMVSRVTVEPGAHVEDASLPYPSLVYIEKGKEIICPPGGEGRYIYDAEGKLINSGAEEMPFPEHTWCYTSPNTLDGARNNGSEQASALFIEFRPTTE